MPQKLITSAFPTKLSEYPNTPVDINQFEVKAIDELSACGVFISDDLPGVLKQLCGVLNLSITDPRLEGFANKDIWAFPAQTGVGKSVALQVYVSMLNDVGSLIVVSQKSEAQSYSERINRLRQSSIYACCFYHAQTKSEEHQYWRIDALEKSPCLIITHKRFESFNGNDDTGLDEILNYKDDNGDLKRRALVVIDEKLSFFKETLLTMDEADRLFKFLDNAMQHSPASKKICNPNKLSTPLNKIGEFWKQEVSCDTNKPVSYVSEFEQYQFVENALSAVEPIDKTLMEKVITARFSEVRKEINGISGVDDEKRLRQEEGKAQKLADTLARITSFSESKDFSNYRPFILYKTSLATYLMKVTNRYGVLGSVVVLDATASVNEFYKLANRSSFSQIKLLDVPQIRQYSNLTIHKAKGVYQSKSALLTNGKPKQEEVESYLKIAKSIVTANDKLLIVGYKEFVKSMNNLNYFDSEDQVQFTHWGNHVGKNDWNDCNKVMIIGWNHFPPQAHVSRIYGTGLGTSDLMITKKVDKALIDKFSITQIVDDIVQAVMRSQARFIDSADSDCKPADIYIFYPDTQFGEDVIGLVVKQFPLAKVKDWNPLAIKKKKSKPEQNADKIIDAIKIKLTNGKRECSWKDARTITVLSPSTFSKAIQLDYFKDQLKVLGCDVREINSKSKKFVFNCFKPVLTKFNYMSF